MVYQYLHTPIPVERNTHAECLQPCILILMLENTNSECLYPYTPIPMVETNMHDTAERVAKQKWPVSVT